MFSLKFFAHSEWCSTYGEHRDQTLLRGVPYRRMKTIENSKPVIQKNWSRSLMRVHSRIRANKPRYDCLSGYQGPEYSDGEAFCLGKNLQNLPECPA